MQRALVAGLLAVVATSLVGTWVGAELDYFTTNSPESLRGHGITPEVIVATRDAFYDALAEGDFDVLHISCHAESPHQSIERAEGNSPIIRTGFQDHGAQTIAGGSEKETS